MKRFLIFLAACGLTLVSHAATTRYDRLYVFGDSFSDIGAGYVDGNGPTAVAYLAERMALSFSHSAAPVTSDQSIDFAVSGARTGEGEGNYIGSAFMHVGLTTQVRDFEKRVKAGELVFNPDTTLFFFAGGLNDRSVGPEVTLRNLNVQIGILQSLGARHFTVALLPTKIPDFAEQGEKLNPALRSWVAEYREREKIDLTLNDWGPSFDYVLEHARDYGFTNSTDACAGREIFNEDTKEQGDPAKYYYYHGGHPSTAVHRIVGEMLFKQLFGSVAARPPSDAPKGQGTTAQ